MTDGFARQSGIAEPKSFDYGYTCSEKPEEFLSTKIGIMHYFSQKTSTYRLTFMDRRHRSSTVGMFKINMAASLPRYPEACFSQCFDNLLAGQ